MIVNADDFGWDDRTNRGIALAFHQGLISSATLMANQDGFQQAVEIARELGLEQHVGVHLVLTSGTPLTEPIRRFRRFCDEDGQFHSWREESRCFFLPRSEREAVVAELTAQVARVRLAGLPVTHLDSHHQVHNEWAIGGCVLDVAKAFGIPYVRLARNCGPSIHRMRVVYKRMFNRRLERRGAAATKWFGDIDDWVHLATVGPGSSSLRDFELMTHPALDEHEVLVEQATCTNERATLSSLLAPVDKMRPFVSYTGRRYGHP